MTNQEQAFLALVSLGFFSVDNDGRIWRHKKIVKSKWSGAITTKKLTPRRAETSRSTYLKVMFWTPSGRLAVYAHRIIWMLANQADIPDRIEVNHKDGDKFNNHPSNLELVTHTENTLHSFREIGRKVKEQRGIKNTSAKLTEEQVLEIRDLCRNGTMTQEAIANLYGVRQKTVSEIHLRKTWKHVP